MKLRLLEKLDRNDLAAERSADDVEVPVPDDELHDLADAVSWEDWGADR